MGFSFSEQVTKKMRRDPRAARGLNRKFGPAPQTPLEAEKALSIITPLPEKQRSAAEKRIDDLIKEAKRLGNAAAVQALEMHKYQLLATGTDESVKMSFLKDFWAWLVGQGKDEDVKKTWWGRTNMAKYDPTIREYIEGFMKKRQEYAMALWKLETRAPENLNEAYLYFKYIVRGGVKQNEDGSFDFRDNSFLDDWELLLKVFNKDPQVHDTPLEHNEQAAPTDEYIQTMKNMTEALQALVSVQQKQQQDEKRAKESAKIAQIQEALLAPTTTSPASPPSAEGPPQTPQENPTAPKSQQTTPPRTSAPSPQAPPAATQKKPKAEKSPPLPSSEPKGKEEEETPLKTAKQQARAVLEETNPPPQEEEEEEAPAPPPSSKKAAIKQAQAVLEETRPQEEEEPPQPMDTSDDTPMDEEEEQSPPRKEKVRPSAPAVQATKDALNQNQKEISKLSQQLKQGLGKFKGMTTETGAPFVEILDELVQKAKDHTNLATTAVTYGEVATQKLEKAGKVGSLKQAEEDSLNAALAQEMSTQRMLEARRDLKQALEDTPEGMEAESVATVAAEMEAARQEAASTAQAELEDRQQRAQQAKALLESQIPGFSTWQEAQQGIKTIASNLKLSEDVVIPPAERLLLEQQLRWKERETLEKKPAYQFAGPAMRERMLRQAGLFDVENPYAAPMQEEEDEGVEAFVPVPMDPLEEELRKRKERKTRVQDYVTQIRELELPPDEVKDLLTKADPETRKAVRKELSPKRGREEEEEEGEEEEKKPKRGIELMRQKIEERRAFQERVNDLVDYISTNQIPKEDIDEILADDDIDSKTREAVRKQLKGPRKPPPPPPPKVARERAEVLETEQLEKDRAFIRAQELLAAITENPRIESFDEALKRLRTILPPEPKKGKEKRKK